MAETDLRQIGVATSINSADAYKAQVERLQKQMGEIAIMDERSVSPMEEELDQAGLNELRGLGSLT